MQAGSCPALVFQVKGCTPLDLPPLSNSNERVLHPLSFVIGQESRFCGGSWSIEREPFCGDYCEGSWH